MDTYVFEEHTAIIYRAAARLHGVLTHYATARMGYTCLPKEFINGQSKRD
jgi:hypothetical protein